MLHLLTRHFFKQLVDLLHDLFQLLWNHLIEEFVDLFLFLDEIFVAQVVLFHEVFQLFLLLLQLVPFILDLLLFLQQVFHLFLIRPIQVFLLDEVLQHLFDFVLQLVSLLRLFLQSLHDVFRLLIGDAVQSRLRRLVVGESLRAFRLGTMETVVVPNHKIDLHILSWHDAKAVHVELVEERGASLFEVQRHRLDDILFDGFLDHAVEGQAGEAVVVGNKPRKIHVGGKLFVERLDANVGIGVG